MRILYARPYRFRAIVCADTAAQAQAAAEKVRVELEQLPAYLSAPAAMAEDAVEIHPGTPNTIIIEVTRQCELGCPVCYAAAPSKAPDPSLDEVGGLLRRAREAGPGC